jgi:hypothetical protein
LRKPQITPLRDPVNLGNGRRNEWNGRELTRSELAEIDRQEAAQTWSPSTKPVPVRDRSLTPSRDPYSIFDEK